MSLMSRSTLNKLYRPERRRSPLAIEHILLPAIINAHTPYSVWDADTIAAYYRSLGEPQPSLNTQSATLWVDAFNEREPGCMQYIPVIVDLCDVAMLAEKQWYPSKQGAMRSTTGTIESIIMRAREVDVPPTAVIVHINRRAYDNRFSNLYVLSDPSEIPKDGNHRSYGGVNRVGNVCTVVGGDGTKYTSPREAAIQADRLTRTGHLAAPLRAYNYPNATETCAQCEVDLPALWAAAPNYPIFIGDYMALCRHRRKGEQKEIQLVALAAPIAVVDIDGEFIAQYLAMPDADRAAVREYAQRQIAAPAPPYHAI